MASLFRRTPRSETELARATAALAAKLDDQTALLQSLIGTAKKQAQQIKQLRELVEEQDRRWQATATRTAAGHAEAVKDVQAAQQRSEARWQERFDRDALRQKREAKWRVTFARQVGAVVRRLCLPPDLPQPFRLMARRFQLRSQFEEDGLLLALVDHVGAPTRRFVEIGSGRTGGNSGALAFDCGWSGLMIDASARAIDSLRQKIAALPRVQAVCATVSSDTINDLLAAHGCTGEVDVLSLDIDSYDYWVLEALSVCRPRILILEYNAVFGSTRAVTVPDKQPLGGTPKGYHGASLAALAAAARRKGYRLVICEHSGVNAFFVRNDLAPDLPEMRVAQAFRPALSRVDFDEEIPVIDIYALAAQRGLPLAEVSQ